MRPEEKGEQIIKYVAEKRNISEGEAKRLLHCYVCQGSCDWYKNKREAENSNFKAGLPKEETRKLEQEILEVCNNLDEARKAIHFYICHK